jgi:hypothetical protein
MDTHQTTKLKTDDTEKPKRKLLTFNEFLTVNDPTRIRNRTAKKKGEEMCDS